MEDKTFYHIIKGNRGKIIDILIANPNISQAELERLFEKKYKKSIDHRAFFQHLSFLHNIGLVSFNVLENKPGKPKQIIFHKDKFEKLHEEEIKKSRAFFIRGFPVEKQIEVLKVLKEKSPITTENFSEELYKSNFDSNIHFLIPELISLGYIENYYKISKSGLEFLKNGK